VALQLGIKTSFFILQERESFACVLGQRKAAGTKIFVCFSTPKRSLMLFKTYLANRKRTFLFFGSLSFFHCFIMFKHLRNYRISLLNISFQDAGDVVLSGVYGMHATCFTTSPHLDNTWWWSSLKHNPTKSNIQC